MCNNFSAFLPGKSWQDKVRELRETLRKKKAYALVVTALDEIACEFLYIFTLTIEYLHH